MSDEQAQGYIDHLHDIHESAKFDKEMTALDVFKKSTKELSRAISEQGMTEFNLSEKIVDLNGFTNGLIKRKYYLDGDVKEFIRELKNRLELREDGPSIIKKMNLNRAKDKIIDKLAGEKLIVNTTSSN